MTSDDPFERTNAASGTTLNDGEAILAAVREQHRNAPHPESCIGLPMVEERPRETRARPRPRRSR